MKKTRLDEIRKEQKKSLYFKEITNFFLHLSRDEKDLQGFIVTRVELSARKTLCSVYLFSPQGEEHFRSVRELLKLYKGSLRTHLAQTLRNRYVPEIVFYYDHAREKQERVSELLRQMKDEEL